MKKDTFFLLLGGGLVLALDQWTKSLVRQNLAIGEQWAPWDWLYPYARIVHWTNRGAAFGIFQRGSAFFTVLAFIVGILILYYFPRVSWRDWSLKVAMMLQFGGALGNLTDRLLRGHVTDFISVGSFAVFNVADASISIGAAVLVLGMWLSERRSQVGGEDTLPLVGEHASEESSLDG